MFGKYKEVIEIFWKYDDKQKYKVIIEASMVSNTEELTIKIPMDLLMLGTSKNPGARNLLSKISARLNEKQRTSVRIMGYDKTKSKEISKDSYLRYSITKWILHKNPMPM